MLIRLMRKNKSTINDANIKTKTLKENTFNGFSWYNYPTEVNF